jgi:hypothetical protein
MEAYIRIFADHYTAMVADVDTPIVVLQVAEQAVSDGN